MVEEAAVLVVRDHEEHILEERAVPAVEERVVDAPRQPLSFPDVVRGMVVVLAPWIDADAEVRIDPRDRWQRALPRGLEELVHLVDRPGRQAVVDVRPQEREIVGVVLPADAAVRQLVKHRARGQRRRHGVVFLAFRRARDRVKAVRLRRPGDRRMPVVADAVLPGEQVEDRQFGGVVIPHDPAEIARRDFREVRHESRVPARYLIVHVFPRMPRIVFEDGAGQARRRVGHAAVRVGFRAGEAVDGKHILEPQVPEHVVERPVLQHQNDDVLDLIESRHSFTRIARVSAL